MQSAEPVRRGWEVKRLKWSVANAKNGVWGSDPAGNANDIKCIRVADFDRVKMSVTDIPTMRNVSMSERNGRVVSAGDLLLEKSGGGEMQPVGAVAMYLGNEAAVCSNFVARVSAAPSVDARFFLYVHAALYSCRINVRSIKQTSGIQNLDAYAYLSEYVAYPPIAMQKEIASFLDRETAEADTLVAKYERLIEILEEKRVALATRAVTKGLDPSVPVKDSGIEWIGSMPAHWDIARLGDVVSVINGYPFDSTQFNPTIGIPLVRIRDIGRDTTEAYYTGEFVESARLRTGELVIGMDGDFNVAQWRGPEALLNQRLCAIRSLSPISERFLFYVLPMPLRIINDLTYSTTVKHLSSYDVRKIRVPLPPHNELRSVVQYLDQAWYSIERLKITCESAIKLVREHRAALINAAVTGQIDVTNHGSKSSQQRVQHNDRSSQGSDARE
jgi:type I restriction enzyme S subunit